MSLDSLEQPERPISTQPLAKEAEELARSLDELRSKLEQASKENQNPTSLEEQVLLIEASFHQYDLRIKHRVEEVKNIMIDETTYYKEKMECLRKIPAKELALLMYHTLQDENFIVRRFSSSLIYCNLDPACLRSLLDFSLGDSDREVRVNAATALKDTSDPEFLKILRQGLRNPDVSVRETSAWALERTRDSECVKFLAEFGMRDEDPRVIEASVIALTGNGDPVCLNAIRELGLKSAHESVRILSLHCLWGTTDIPCINAIIQIAKGDEDKTETHIARHALNPKELTPLELLKWAGRVGSRIALSYITGAADSLLNVFRKREDNKSIHQDH